MVLNKIKEQFHFVIDRDESLSLENRLFLSTIVLGIITSLLGSLVSLILSSSLITIITAIVLFLLLLILYTIVRIKNTYKPFLIPLISISFIGISVIWIFDGGINGSDIMPAFVVLILALIIAPEKTRKYIIALFIALIITIYLIQYYRPDLITGFPSEKARWTDSIVTAIYSAFFIFLIIRFLLKNYSIEKHRAAENEIKFRALSENSHDRIARFDRGHRYTYINRAGIEVLGLKPEKIIGKTPREIGFYNNELSGIFIDTIEKAFTTKQSQFVQYSFDGANAIKYYELSIYPEFSDMNEIVSVLGVTHDITILKQTELKLIKLNADKDLFMSILAHDLRNPFNSILGLSGLLLDEMQDMDMLTIEKYIGVINTTSLKTYNLLEDLLLWTKSQSGKLEFKPKMTDIMQTCLNTIENIRSNAQTKKIALNFFATSHISILADEDMVKVVLRNLISNAIKFTFPGGIINVSAEQIESDVLVTVSDNGVGIAAERIDKLFDISKIVTTEGTSNEKGTGLGLLLCREFVENHGGRIWVESIEGKGSDFKFTLPVNTTDL
jgi:PAS domain S-box-containing protein